LLFVLSALQCLSNVLELTEYFINDEHSAEINTSNPLGTHGRLVKAYADLLKDMWSGQFSSVRPCHLKVICLMK
jgi:ubiquitin C-terminal hydrolase